jgi:hypothetical protein
MNPKRLGRLAAIVLLTSSMALANSALLKKESLLSANGQGLIATPSPGTTVINQANISSLINTGGTITFNPTTQTLTLTSTITEIFTGNQTYLGDFGTITFTTGALQSGSLFGYAMFGGGTFTITTDGADGLPNGTLLTTISGGVYWREVGNTNNYYLYAPVNGSGWGGNVHELSTWSSGNTFTVNQGATVIPEPNTLALLVTGMIGLAGAVRKKVGSIHCDRSSAL